MIPSEGGAGETPFVLAVASGKGGTGKTLVATNVSASAASGGASVVLVDCDVEAPNDHLFLRRAHESSMAVEVCAAQVDASRCDACGRCRDACAYGAVRILGGSAIVFDELCHGCGLCADVCPTGAAREIQRRVGEVVWGFADGRPGLSVITGRLDVGQVKAPAVIRSARQVADAAGGGLTVLDAPPGVACSAVAAVRGADALLLVTEPTAFGLHDLELSLRLGRDLGLPMAVVVNRVGTGVADIDGLCREWGVPIVARIPFDRDIARAYARGILAADESPVVSRLLSHLPETVRRLTRREAVAR